jgi:hypothetical protein
MSKPRPADIAWTDIVEPKELTIAYLWTLFAGHVIPVTAPRFQREEMRKAFYAGFVECFKVINDVSVKLPEPQSYQLLERISNEANEFFEQMMKEHPPK